MNIQLKTNAIPSDFCFRSFPQDWSNLVGFCYSEISNSYASAFVAKSPPPPDNIDDLWMKLDSNGNPIRIYKNNGGIWLARHPMSPGDVIMRFIADTGDAALNAISNLDLVVGEDPDAGSYTKDSAVTESSGPFWQSITAVDADYAARIPIHPGNLPSGTAVDSGSKGGEETHELISTEMPYHRHYITNGLFRAGAATPYFSEADAGAVEGNGGYTNYTGGDPDDSNNVVPHNTMPPYFGIYFCQRTARIYYRGL